VNGTRRGSLRSVTVCVSRVRVTVCSLALASRDRQYSISKTLITPSLRRRFPLLSSRQYRLKPFAKRIFPRCKMVSAALCLETGRRTGRMDGFSPALGFEYLSEDSCLGGCRDLDLRSRGSSGVAGACGIAKSGIVRGCLPASRLLCGEVERSEGVVARASFPCSWAIQLAPAPPRSRQSTTDSSCAASGVFGCLHTARVDRGGPADVRRCGC
jgi:hypothetical protein